MNARQRGLTRIFSFSKNCMITFRRYSRFTASSFSPAAPPIDVELELVLVLRTVDPLSDGAGEATRLGDNAPCPLVMTLGLESGSAGDILGDEEPPDQ